MTSMTKNLKTPKSVLAVFAHPDDMDILASGTIAKWIAHGCEVTHLVCTDGGRGSDDPRMTRHRLAAIRREEQLKAAKVLGVRDVIFLRHPDGELAADMQLKEKIVRVIRMKKPELVMTLDPAYLYSLARGTINHPDHRAAGEAAMDAVFPLARDRLHFPAHERLGIKPHKTKILLLISVDDPNHLEDISETIHTKIVALKAHPSQIRPDALARIKERGVMLGRRMRMKYAEGFKRLELR